MLKAEFHIHTKEDPLDAIKYSAKQAISYCSKLKYEVMSITCHTKILFNKELKDYAKQKNILLIPGIEAFVEGKDVLIINPPTDFDNKKIMKLRQLEKLKQENALIIAPHPFYPRKDCLGNKLIKNIDLFDGIEYCHLYHKLFNLFNKKAIKIARKYNKPLIGTSDAHKLFQLNNTFTLVDSEKKTDSILEAIRKQKTKLITRPLKSKQFFSIGQKAVLSYFHPKSI